MMKIEKVFNSMGFAGRFGKLGTVIAKLRDDVDGLLEDVPAIAADVNEIKPNLNDLTELVNKIKALVNVTVTFDTDGGSSVESQTIPFGTHANPPEAPTKEGFVLFGWYLDNEPFDFGTPIESNIIIIAAWIESE
ncbi:MAG: InlB B-repeat-containing protein [Clostridiaceae bacterium]|nr:InlB B-repeat-containing protein [Clostridiaceae bacterium]